MTETTRYIRWHGRDISAVTETIKIGEIETCVEVPNLPDAGLRHIIGVATAAERIDGANKIAPVHVIEMALCRWRDEGGTIESWRRFESSIAVQPSRTRPAKGTMQPFFRWLHGGKPDTQSYYDDLAAVADAWLTMPTEERPDPRPKNGEPGTSDFAKWIAERHGYVAVAAHHRHPEEGELRVLGISQNPKRKSPRVNPYDPNATWWAVYQWQRRQQLDDADEFRWVLVSKEFDTLEAAKDELAREQAEMEAEAEMRRFRDGEPISDENINNDKPATTRSGHSESISENSQPQTRPAVSKDGYTGRAPGASGGEKARSYSESEHQYDADLLSENARLKARVTELENELAVLKGQPHGPEIKKQFVVTPPPLYVVLYRPFHFDFDPCPLNRRPGFNSLREPWGLSNFVNSPFSARLNPEGFGPTDFVRKAIEENRLGKNSVLLLPTMNYVNMLLEADAEAFAIGRVPWQEAETREPQPSPPHISGFVLWGSQFTEGEKATIMARLKTEIAKLGYGTTAPDNLIPLRRHGT
jgi:hypothetical protein